MAKQVESSKAASLVKREPVMMVSGVVTLLSTALFVAPALGIKIPDKITKSVSLGMTALGAFGIRSLVKPA